MAVQTIEVECWVLVDEVGNYVAHSDDSELANAYEEAFQPVADAAGIRRVKITLSIPLPAIIEVTGAVAAVEPETTLTAK